MARPNVSIVLQNGGLGLAASGETGIAVLLIAAPAAPTSGYGVAKLITSKEEAATEFADEDNADVLEAIVNGFFAEAPEGTKLYTVAWADTVTLTEMAAAVKAEIALNAAAGKARLVGVIKYPSGAYTPTITQGMDAEVDTAVTALQTLADAWLAKKKPFRALLPAYAFTNASDARDYSTATKRNVGIVVGTINDNPGMGVAIALGRAAKVGPQVNIGRVKSGSLNIAEDAVVKLGSTAITAIADSALTSLHTKRYITFEPNQIAAGYIFNDDNMLVAATDDYNNLRYGRVIDNAVRTAYTAYYEELKDDVLVDEDGRLDKVVEKALEAKIQSAIDRSMRGQLNLRKDGTADIIVMANPDTVQFASLYSNNGIASPNLNILQSETVYLFLFLKPKGCIKYINIYLGFTATS